MNSSLILNFTYLKIKVCPKQNNHGGMFLLTISERVLQTIENRSNSEVFWFHFSFRYP